MALLYLLVRDDMYDPLCDHLWTLGRNLRHHQHGCDLSHRFLAVGSTLFDELLRVGVTRDSELADMWLCELLPDGPRTSVDGLELFSNGFLRSACRVRHLPPDELADLWDAWQLAQQTLHDSNRGPVET